MTEAPKTVTITATLTDDEPYNETGPDLMQSAGDKIQKALAEVGYTPR